MLLSMEHKTVDDSQWPWRFYMNAQSDIPQQSNNYDCEVHLCLYARCLFLYYPLPISNNAFWKQIVIELHQHKIEGPEMPERHPSSILLCS